MDAQLHKFDAHWGGWIIFQYTRFDFNVEHMFNNYPEHISQHGSWCPLQTFYFSKKNTTFDSRRDRLHKPTTLTFVFNFNAYRVKCVCVSLSIWCTMLRLHANCIDCLHYIILFRFIIVLRMTNNILWNILHMYTDYENIR